MPKPSRSLIECPHCGAEFRAGRLACPECGSDADTGWKDAEEIDYASVELPDHDGEDRAGRRSPWWWVAILLALVAMLAIALLR